MPQLQLKRWAPLLLTIVLAGLFTLLFFGDNKYQTPPPYGRGGVLRLTEADIRREMPIFLIDGWLLTDTHTEQEMVYIGQFGSLRRADPTVSPHGSATYELTLRYTGAPIEACIDFPQLFTRHQIFFDGALLSEGIGGAQVSVHLNQGDHQLTVETASTHGYYSGMYHPASIGTLENVAHILLSKCIAYSVALLVPLALALFTLVLWWRGKDRVALWFGLLCIAFSAYVSYYFVRLLGFAVSEYWYLVQSAAFYQLCFCVLRLAALDGGLDEKRSVRWMQRMAGVFAVVLLLLATLIPTIPWAVSLHNALTNAFCIFIFCGILLLTFFSRAKEGWEHLLTRLACLSFAVGLVSYLFGSGFLSLIDEAFDLFEPIRFYWQFEWCGLFLVLLFAGMMVARNRRILAENAAFQTQLEEMVQQRTIELRNLLQERKVFFADMAHDIKAPLYAAASYIQEIRAHNTGIDSELLRYINLVEKKQQEVTRRVQGLTTFNKMDELIEPYARISVQTLLAEIEQNYRIAMRAQSVHFSVQPPETDGFLYAKPQKLLIMFENIIFNAMRATPPGGRVTVSAELDTDGCHLSVEDTGCGIPPDELPHIFDRFFVGKQNMGTGSGLGLYIVKAIVDELQGEISICSKPGQGVTFYVDLPLAEG